MPKYISFVPLLVLVLVGAGCHQPPSSPEQVTNMQPTEQTQKFCSPDNKIIDHQVKQSFNSYCLVPVSTEPLVSGKAQNYSFTILNNAGETVKNFPIVHEKMLHVILMNKNFIDFQHLHPNFDATSGIFTIPNLIFPKEGEYILYADFVADAGSENKGIQQNQVVSHSLQVGDDEYQNTVSIIPDRIDRAGVISKNLKNYNVSLQGDSFDTFKSNLVRQVENNLSFEVAPYTNDQPKPLEPYLGSYGHLVILQENTYQYIHTHPLTTEPSNIMNFHVTFPMEGKYKLFFEFKLDGNVERAEYVVDVGTGVNVPKGTGDHSGMDHT